MESPGAAVNVKCTNRAIINHVISLFSYRRLFSRTNHNGASIHPCDKGISFLLILVAFETRQLDYNVRPCIYFDEKIFYLSSIFFSCQINRDKNFNLLPMKISHSLFTASLEISIALIPWNLHQN